MRRTYNRKQRYNYGGVITDPPNENLPIRFSQLSERVKDEETRTKKLRNSAVDIARKFSEMAITEGGAHNIFDVDLDSLGYKNGAYCSTRSCEIEKKAGYTVANDTNYLNISGKNTVSANDELPIIPSVKEFVKAHKNLGYEQVDNIAPGDRVINFNTRNAIIPSHSMIASENKDKYYYSRGAKDSYIEGIYPGGHNVGYRYVGNKNNLENQYQEMLGSYMPTPEKLQIEKNTSLESLLPKPTNNLKPIEKVEVLNNETMYKTKKRKEYKMGGTVDTLLNAGLPMLDAAVPGLGTALSLGKNLVQGEMQKVKQRKLDDEMKQNRLDQLVISDKSSMSGYPTKGVSQYSFPMGGLLPYNNEKFNPMAGEEEQLSSSETKFKGNTHEEGGIPIDPNMDGRPEAEVEGEEVASGNRVYSDRLQIPTISIPELRAFGLTINPSDTFAAASEKIARKKGMFEADLNSFDTAKKNTAERMISRFEEAMEKLFNIQESMKPQQSEGEVPTMAYGGIMPSKVKNKGYMNMISYEQRVGYKKSDDVLAPAVHPKTNEVYYRFGHEDWTSKNKSSKYPTKNFSSNTPLKLSTSSKEMKPSLTGQKVERYQRNRVRNFTEISETPITSTSKEGNFLNRNQDHIANAALFASNMSAVNRLQTTPRMSYAPNPIYNYRDLSGQERSESASDYRTAMEGVRMSGANKSNMQAIQTAKTRANAATTNAEFGRRMQYDNAYDGQRLNAGFINAGISNQGEQIRMTNENAKIAASQQATQSLVQGINNIRQRDSMVTMDERRSMIELLKVADPKVLEDIMKQTGTKDIEALINYMIGK